MSHSFAATVRRASLVVLALVFAAAPETWAAAFTPGNIVVARVGDGTAALSGNTTAAFLEEYSPAGGAAAQVLALPVAVSGGNKQLTILGSTTSEAQLIRSADGHYLSIGGYALSTGTLAATATAAGTARTVGRIDSLGVIDTSTSFTEATATGNFRSAVSFDGTQFWISTSTGGTRYVLFGASSGVAAICTAPANQRVLGIYSNQLYGTASSGAFQSVFTVGSGLPTISGQTATTLPGMPTAAGPSPYTFVLFDRSPSVPGFDSLYLVDDRAVPNGGIQKWSFDGTNWTLRGTIAVDASLGARGLAAAVSGSNVVLYATTTATSANKLITVTDTAAFDQAPVTAGVTVLATAATNTVFRGVAFAPVAPVAAPSAPTNLVATAGNAHVSLTWTAATGATGYKVKRATVSGGPYTTIAPNVSTNSYDDTTASNETQYFYVVSATNSGGESSNSSEASAVPSVPPSVVSISRASATPTNASAVSFTVLFSRSVTGVDTSDFALSTSVADAVITQVSGSGNSYTVDVSTGTSSGLLRLDLTDDDSIVNAFNAPLGGPGAGNGSFTSGETYSIDHTAPAVVSITTASPNPTSASTVDYSVLFSEPVSGVDANDFAVQQAGVTGAGVTSVLGSGTTWSVTVSTGSGNSGTVQLNLTDNDTIVDGVGNPLGGPGLGNGNVSGPAYNINRDTPTVVGVTRLSANPINASSVDFSVVFTTAVSGVDASDFALHTTGTIIGSTIGTPVSNDGTTWTVNVSNISGDGTLRLDVTDDDSIHSATNVPLGGAGTGNGNFAGGETYTIDRTNPYVLSVVRASASPTNSAQVTFTVTFDEAVTGVDATDFAPNVTGLTGATVASAAGSGSSYTVVVNSGSGDGNIALDVVDDDTIADAAGNKLGGTGTGNGNFTGGEVFTVDKTAPVVQAINHTGTTPTSASSVDFAVAFSESVSGVDASDFALATSGISGAAITGVTGSACCYTVTVSTGAGVGTIRLDVVDNDSILDAAGNPLGGPGAGNGNFSGTGQEYTVNGKPATPTSLIATAGDAHVALTWTAPSGASTYNVKRATVSGGPYTTIASSVATTSYDDTGLTDGTTYFYVVSAVNAQGEGVDSSQASATPIATPAVPTGLAAAASDARVVLTWGTTSGATSYQVKRAMASGGPYSIVGTPVTPTFTDVALANGTQYFYVVAAVNGSGTSGDSSEVSVTPNSAALLGVVISQIYGGGGNTGATLKNDFIELFNRGNQAVSLNGWSAQYVSAGGATWNATGSPTVLSGTIAPGHYYLIQESAGTGGTASLPTPDAVGTIAIAATAGKIGLASNTSAFSVTCPTGSFIGDFVGFGTTANCFEGTGPTPAPSNTLAVFRAGSGCTDTNNNVADFVTNAPAPRNSSSAINPCAGTTTNPSGTASATPSTVLQGGSTLLRVVVTPGQSPTSTGISVTANLTSIGGTAAQALFDDATNGDVTAGDGTFSFNATVAPATTAGAKSLPVTITDAQTRTGSASISLTVQSASAPSAPTGLSATAGDHQVSLSWTASSGATGYNVKRATVAGGPYTTIAPNVAPTSYVDMTAANGTRYYYVVSALNGSGESADSSEVNALPAAPIADGVTGKVYFIDIGQGASTLIVSPTGKTLLVDGGETGKGTSKVIPTLNALGISTLDYTVLTHYHIDHDGGLAEVINAGRLAGTAYDNGDDPTLIPPNFSTSPASTYGAYTTYVNAITSHSGTVTRAVATPGTVIDLGGGMRATIMAQGGHLLSGGRVTIDNSDLNTESISVFVEYNNFDFLVSGDLTGGGSTDTAKTPDVETFVGQMVGDIDAFEFDHHGSTTANGRRLLKILKAEMAEAEAGFTNTFGHPNRETFNKFLNIPDTAGNTYGGTGLPAPGSAPVAYQTDPSPTSDDRCTRQGYSGAAPADAGAGTLLLKTNGTTNFTMESFDDGGVRIAAGSHVFPLDATGAGVTTNFPPTVQPTITPAVPLATDTVTVNAAVFDREDPISSVTLNYAIEGVSQTPVAMSFSGGTYTAMIAPQSDGTRVDYTVTAVANGQSTSYSTGYFAGTTPISKLRAMDALGSPLYWDYAARVQGVVTSGTGNYGSGTNDDYLQDASGAINIWRTIQPTVPAVQFTTAGKIYSVAGLIGESAGKLRLEVTPPFVQTTTPYQITFIADSTVPAPLVMTIAQISANSESLEARLITINNCTVTSGTIPAAGAGIDAFLTISDGTGTFQLKVDHNTDIPGMATPSGTFAVTGILQQDDFLRPFDSNYDIAPRNQVDLGGSAAMPPALMTIADARIDVDGSGNAPGDYVPDRLNQTVHIQGVVTSINFRGSNGSGIEYYIQDSTAGVDVFSTATTRSFSLGDNLDVIGVVKQFNGLTEVDPGATPANLTLLAPNTLPAVTPQVVTLSQIGNSGAGEPLEGRLVRVNNITLTSPPATFAAGTNYTVSDSTGTCASCFRVSASSNLVGTAAPTGAFSAIGLVGQFDNAAPFDSGYQLLPRSTADILPPVSNAAAISASAGTPQSAAVNTTFATALAAMVTDSGNAPVSGVGVTFTAPASGASGTFAGGNASTTVATDSSGVATAPAFTANSIGGNYNVTATVNSLTATFSLTNTTPPVATHFSVSMPSSVTAGTAFNATVTALDASNLVVTGYLGTIHFTSSSAGTLPADYTFVNGDSGAHTFSVTLTTTGSQSLSVSDSTISGTANTAVAAPAATHFSVSIPANVTAGTAFNATVTALDASNTVVSGYVGTIHFSSSSAGTLPGDYTFVGGDSGAHTFSVTLTSTGSQSITVTDTANGSITGTASTTVGKASSTTSVATSGSPSTAGNSVTFTATVTTGAAGTVTFKDGSATIGTGTLNGMALNRATFTTSALAVGAHTITAVYEGDGNYLTSTSGSITQNVNSINSGTTITSSPNPSTLGASVTMTATVVTGATGSVTFLDGATPLGSVALNGLNPNQAMLSTSALTAGTHTLMASYGGDSTHGSSANSVMQTVNGASATTSTITASPTSIKADGSSTSTITVRLKDVNGNNLTVSGGTVTLSTTRGALSAVTDNADGTYSATLTSSMSAGNATITGTINGTPITASAVVTFTGSLADFNNDGKSDIVWRNYTSGTNALWLMNGTTKTSVVVLDPIADSTWKMVGLGDFNGDGKTDILWRNYPSGNNAIWFMDGTTKVSVASIDPLPDAGWRVEAVADFNGDGKPDILWRNYTSGTNALWIMNGATKTSVVTLDPINDSTWKIVGAADFNGDGKTDILWRNYVSGTNAVWLMDGTVKTSVVVLDPIDDPSWKIEGTGDFNGDGKADILWRNYISGTNAVWLMNGTVKTSVVVLDPIIESSWKIQGIGEFDNDGTER